MIERLREQAVERMRALEQAHDSGETQAKSVERQGGFTLPDEGDFAVLLDALEPHAQRIAPMVRKCARMCSVRLQTPGAADKALPWHQDAQPMKMMPKMAGVVAWVPLDDIDGTRPDLEFGPIVGRVLKHTNTERHFAEQCEVEVDEREPVYGMRQGDVMFFSPYQLHRTRMVGERERYSIDVRFREGW